METTRVTPKIAFEICSGPYLDLEEFVDKAHHNEYIMFTHFNFFYSHPEFGKQWPNGEQCEYHSIETMCNCCRKKPDRNFAGVGTLYLKKSIIDSDKGRLVLFCKSCRDWRNTEKFNPTPLIKIQPLQYKLI